MGTVGKIAIATATSYDLAALLGGVVLVSEAAEALLWGEKSPSMAQIWATDTALEAARSKLATDGVGGRSVLAFLRATPAARGPRRLAGNPPPPCGSVPRGRENAPTGFCAPWCVP